MPKKRQAAPPRGDADGCAQFERALASLTRTNVDIEQQQEKRADAQRRLASAFVGRATR